MMFSDNLAIDATWPASAVEGDGVQFGRSEIYPSQRLLVTSTLKIVQRSSSINQAAKIVYLFYIYRQQLTTISPGWVKTAVLQAFTVLARLRIMPASSALG
jgi:hypothetical protein